MKKAMIAMLLAGGTMFGATHINIGIGFGSPAPVAVVRPACPGPGYVWVDGYYATNHVWVPGFWRAPEVYRAPEVRRAPERIAPAGHFGFAPHREDRRR